MNTRHVVVGPIEDFMTAEHARIDQLLRASLCPDGSVAFGPYAQLRHDLLRHIAMEEKVLLRYAREKRGGEPLPIARQLRVDHGEIAKLLVPTPTAAIIESLRALLERHNRLEEGPGALYACCDALARSDAVTVVHRLRAVPEVPVAPHYDGPEHRQLRVATPAAAVAATRSEASRLRGALSR
jgi:hypothetical protein